MPPARRLRMFVWCVVLLAATVATAVVALTAETPRRGDWWMAAILAAMIALAREHYSAFIAGAGDMPASLRPAFLPVAPVPAYLDRLAHGDLLAQVAELSPLHRQWLITRRALWGWGRA